MSLPGPSLKPTRKVIMSAVAERRKQSTYLSLLLPSLQPTRPLYPKTKTKPGYIHVDKPQGSDLKGSSEREKERKCERGGNVSPMAYML